MVVFWHIGGKNVSLHSEVVQESFLCDITY